MLIPTQFIPIRANKPKLIKKSEITLERTESEPNTSHKPLDSHVVMYEKREGRDRRRRNTKPMLDTRIGRDRRYDQANPIIDIKA